MLRGLVLCARARPPLGDNGWRELRIHEPAKLTDAMVRSECVAKTSRTLNNDQDQPARLTIALSYKSEEGQEWKPAPLEQCELNTVLKSEGVLRKLAEADMPIGLALYGTEKQTVEIGDDTVERAYDVAPHTRVSVTLSVFRQECVLDCPAMEEVFTPEGKKILKRQLDGVWRAVTTRFVETDVVETNIKR